MPIRWPMSRKYTPIDASHQPRPRQSITNGDRTKGTQTMVQFNTPRPNHRPMRRTMRLTIALAAAESSTETGRISNGKRTFLTYCGWLTMSPGALLTHSEKTLNPIKPRKRTSAKSKRPSFCNPQRAWKMTPKTNVKTVNMRSGVTNVQAIPRYEPLYRPRISRLASWRMSSRWRHKFLESATGSRSRIVWAMPRPVRIGTRSTIQSSGELITARSEQLGRTAWFRSSSNELIGWWIHPGLPRGGDPAPTDVSVFLDITGPARHDL